MEIRINLFIVVQLPVRWMPDIIMSMYLITVNLNSSQFELEKRAV